MLLRPTRKKAVVSQRVYGDNPPYHRKHDEYASQAMGTLGNGSLDFSKPMSLEQDPATGKYRLVQKSK